MPRLILSVSALMFVLMLYLHSSAVAAAEKPDAEAPKAADSPEATHNTAPAGWTALFNGKDIEGWVVRSGYATYAAENGMITGTTVEGSGNTFLCAPGEYKDFELTFDVFLHNDELNSGCQVRSKVMRENKHGGRIGGPQVEISAGRQSGFIYGEAGLGGWWSQDIKNRRHDHFKKGQWNRFHVIAKGNNIKTFINDEPIADMTYPEKYKDDFQKGLIGLQVHSVKGDPKWKVSWRNIYIRELSQE